MKGITKPNKGFTLMEMLVVVAIIGILTAISIPIFSSQLEKAREATCAANRRSLLGVVRIEAMTNGVEAGEVFATMYPDVKDEYSCPNGGTFSWVNEMIVCDKHPNNGEVNPSVSVGGGQYQVYLGPDIDSKIYAKGETITVTKGKIFKIGDKYYVGVDNYSPRKVSSDQYEPWLTSSYMVKEVKFDKNYTQSELGTNGLLNGYNGQPVGVGSVYEYDGRLYVQTSNFSGNTPQQSSDPTVNTNYWTLLGTIN